MKRRDAVFVFSVERGLFDIGIATVITRFENVESGGRGGTYRGKA